VYTTDYKYSYGAFQDRLITGSEHDETSQCQLIGKEADQLRRGRRIRGDSEDAISLKVRLGQGIQREDHPRDGVTQYS
jgi:hypothetical protein